MFIYAKAVGQWVIHNAYTVYCLNGHVDFGTCRPPTRSRFDTKYLPTQNKSPTYRAVVATRPSIFIYCYNSKL